MWNTSSTRTRPSRSCAINLDLAGLANPPALTAACSLARHRRRHRLHLVSERHGMRPSNTGGSLVLA